MDRRGLVAADTVALALATGGFINWRRF